MIWGYKLSYYQSYFSSLAYAYFCAEFWKVLEPSLLIN